MSIFTAAVARVLGITTAYVNRRGVSTRNLPQRVSVVGQGSDAVTYSTDPFIAATSREVGAEYGFGSPNHLVALMLKPVDGDGIGDLVMTFYPVQADGSGVVATGSIVPVGTTQTETGEYTILIGGIPSARFVIEKGAVVLNDIANAMLAAISGNINMPALAAIAVAPTVDVTSKWKGASANDLTISVEGPSNGVTFTVVQPVGGAINPSVSPALARITNVWETILVNCMEHGDTTTLDLFESWGLGRWGTLTKKPAIVLTGYTESTTTSGEAIGTARRETDRVNAYITVLGSVSLPLQVAARGAARIARQANDNPPVGYALQLLQGIVPGASNLELDYLAANASVLAGLSTGTVIGGVPALSDTVTFYHPEGEEPPAYRHVVQIMKVFQLIFNINVIFASEAWVAAPLIPDDDPTSNPAARSPKMAKAEVNSMIDSLALDAVLSNPKAAKLLTEADINGSNSNRLDVGVSVQITGNANVISVDLDFGFFFGASA
jgi:phage tail sheath gpL-like